MIVFGIILALSVIGLGVGARFFATDMGYEISWAELGITVAAILVVAMPLTTMIANELSIDQQIGGWNQFINGSVVRANTSSNSCGYDDTSCRTYDCDHYTVSVMKTRSVPSGTDSKGNTTYRTETYWEDEERHHECPYVTVEYNYSVMVSHMDVEEIGIDSAVFDLNPVEWRAGGGISAGLKGKAKSETHKKAMSDSMKAKAPTKLPEGVVWLEPGEYECCGIRIHRVNRVKWESQMGDEYIHGSLSKVASAINNKFLAKQKD